MGVAIFNYAAWAARYPLLAASVDEALATLYFAEAGIYLNNTDCSPVSDVNQRLVLLNMLVAHIAALNTTAALGSGVIGRVSSASEGSVSVTSEYAVPGTDAWFAQTQYGVGYLQATASLRTMRYAPGPRPFLDVPGGGRFPWHR